MIQRLIFIVCLISLSNYATAGCKDLLEPKVGFTFQEFEPTPPLTRPTLNIAGLNLPLIQEKIKGEPLNDSTFRYRVPIGQISKKIFLKLKAAFRGERELKYDSIHFYFLEDFLRPFIQATDGNVYESYVTHEPALEKALIRYSQQTKRYRIKLSLLSFHLFWSTNCWQTVVEFLRHSPTEIGIYYPDTNAATRFFSDTDYFSPLPQEQTQYGDILLIANEESSSKPSRALHVAVFIADDLFYEKTGSDSRALYRFIRREDLERTYPPHSSSWTYLHPTGRAMPPMEFFSAAIQRPKLASMLNLPLMNHISLEVFLSEDGMILAGSGMKTVPYR